MSRNIDNGEGLVCGVATANRGLFRWMVSPVLSLMSNVAASTPSGRAQSNLCMRLANTSSLFAMANAVPGHPLLPAPNGIRWKSCPLKSTVESRNLSGRNSSGSFHEAGSLCIAQALVITCVPAGMS